MANKQFGVKEFTLIGSSGSPSLTSPNNLNLNANTVAISTNISIGGRVTSNLVVNPGNSVGIGSTTPAYYLDVVGGDVRVGINTSQGVILTSPNGTKYRLSVSDAGALQVNPA
jgi:hypothetical protein